MSQTRLTIKDDYVLAYASRSYGANIDAVGINLDLLAKLDFKLAQELMAMVERIENSEIRISE